MTNLEGRVLLRRAGASTRPRGVRSDLAILAGLAARLGRGDGFTDDPSEVFDELRRASRRRPGRLLRHHLRAASTPRTASSGRARSPDHPGTPRLFPDASPPRTGGPGSCAVDHRPAGRGRSTTTIPCTSPPAGCSRSTSPARRPGGSARCEAAPEPFVELHPDAGRHARHRRRASRSA